MDELRQNRITVPCLSSSGLIAQTNKKLKLSYYNRLLDSWNFITDESGKTYEVLTHQLGQEGNAFGSEVIRAFFRERGFSGNTAAFVAWIAKHNPVGGYVSIPDDGQLYKCGSDPRGLCLYVHVSDAFRILVINDVRRIWCGNWNFVAFREVYSSN